MLNFTDDLRECEDCKRFGSHIEEVLKFQPKASMQSNAYDRWKPEKFKTLFIAEAPPWDEPKYFYNAHVKAGSLRRGLFNQLGIEDFGEGGLNIFKQRYFLIDTIKCRLKKQNSNPPNHILRNCARRFLIDEVRSLEPEAIILLGKTAKQGLEQFTQFEDLKKYEIRKDCGKAIKIENYTVVIFVFPSVRNMSTMRTHPLLRAMT